MTRVPLRLVLSASYILLVLSAVILAIILSNKAVQGGFNRYIADSIDTRIHQISTAVLAAHARGPDWNLDALERIGMNALEDGFLLTVVRADNTIIWDARTHNEGLCSEMIASMAERMAGFGSRDAGSYTERAVSLEPLSDRLNVGYWGPVYYRDADIAFLSALNSSLLVAGSIALLLAIFAGIVGARALSAPLLQVSADASRIARGEYNDNRFPSRLMEIHRLQTAIGQMATDLGAQENMRKQLMIDASHELRTPIAALQALLEGMRDKVLRADTETLHRCLEQSSRLGALIHSIERMADTDAAAFRITLNPHPLDDILELACNGIDSYARQSQVRISRESAPHVNINCDPDYLVQAIANVLHNAIRYRKPPTQDDADSGEACRVHISIAEDERTIQINVTDNGIGIPENHLEAIFERFYRVDPSRSRTSGGFGVGLAIVKETVRQHGGSVRAYSNGIGQGSCFSITLPRSLEG